MPGEPYHVVLQLRRSSDESERPGQFEVTLTDTEGAGRRPAIGIAYLDLRQDDEPLPGPKPRDDLPQPLDNLRPGEFLDTFRNGDGGAPADEMRFGLYLLNRILGDAELRNLWNTIRERRANAGRPLRLELILPADDASAVEDIPFELLAEHDGFLFRRHGASVVRVIQDLPPRTLQIEAGQAILAAWANPNLQPRIAGKLLDEHERKTREAADHLGRTLKAPCKEATCALLEERLQEGQGTAVVSLVAHGEPDGGKVWLHRAGHPDYPNDPGDPVSARDLAAVFRKGDVAVAFLWTCFGGRRNPVSGALATTMLHPEHGNLAAVIASHAALRAERTDTILERTLKALRGAAEGDLARAVGEGRRALPEGDLQWAAPVFYGRPRGGSTVTYTSRIEEAADTLRDPAPPVGIVSVEKAPRQSPHFQGRQDEIVRGLSMLRTGQLASVTGAPGMGKTEVALAIAREAAEDPKLGIERAIWFPLDSVTDAGAVRSLVSIAFGLDPQAHSDAAALARGIGSTRALLVLDNAEDPIRSDWTGRQALCATLLRECPELRLLLSTRVKVGGSLSDIEAEVHVPKLGKADARAAFLSATWPVDARRAEQ